MQWVSKYRPKKVQDYVGNTVLKNSVTTLIANNNLPQMVLLEGERGTGKTTMARLIAKSLLCANNQQEGTQGEACDTCESCTAFNAYIETGNISRHVTVYEEDMTKTNKREDASVLVDRMSARVVGGGKKVYILDEMQRTTKEAQSCFLKIAEEPPENLYIIICTTNPEQLLEPLLSRFHRFIVHKPTTKELTELLAKICTEEGVNYQKTGLTTIARENALNPRESINKIDLLAKLGDITTEVVNQEYNLWEDNTYFKFLTAASVGDLQKLCAVQEETEEKGLSSYKEFIEGFNRYVVELLKLRNGVATERFSPKELVANRRLIKQFSEPELLNFLRILNNYTQQVTHYHILSLGADIHNALCPPKELEKEDITPKEQTEKYAEVTVKVEEEAPEMKMPIAEEADILSIFGSSVRKVNR